ASESSIPVSTSRMTGMRSVRASLRVRRGPRRDHLAAWKSREVGIVSYGRTSTYLPARADIVAAPTPMVMPPGRLLPCRRGTNWRPSSLGLSASRGLGLGPQTLEPCGAEGVFSIASVTCYLL